MKNAGRYTSYSPIDDRFSHNKKGIFFCKFNHEILYIGLFSGGIILVLILLFLLTSLPKRGLTGAAGAFIEISAAIISPFLLIGGIRTIRSGVTYNYTADEEKMLIVCPRENFRVDIFYNTVENVTYEEIRYLSKVRGLHVTVYCTHGIYVFELLFGYRTPENLKTPELTPFRYIEERAGLVTPPVYSAWSRIDNI